MRGMVECAGYTATEVAHQRRRGLDPEVSCRRAARIARAGRPKRRGPSVGFGAWLAAGQL